MKPPRPIKPEGLDAPGLTWRPRRDHWEARWIARQDLIKRGFQPRSSRLWAGACPTTEEWRVIGSACSRLQGEMLAWLKVPQDQWDPARLFDDRLESLIKIYEQDPDSPFQKLRYKVRLAYASKSRTLSNAVGSALISQLTFRDFQRWHEKFCAPKKAGGKRRKARGHALMTHLRLVLSFGVLLKLPGCSAARETLAEMVFENPRRRVEIVNREQAILIREGAHEAGHPSIALAQALMTDLMLRQKDVIGEYLPMSEPGLSPYIYRNKKWMVGINWLEISETMILAHRLSKSLRGRDAVMDPDAGKLEFFDLTKYPMVMEELAHVTRREGPLVIREDTGRPWDDKSFNRAWRKIARAKGIPDNVQNRDSRAGAITAAFNAEASPDKIRRAAGHSQLSTTMGYDRGNEQARAEVIELVTKNGQKTA